MGIEVTGGAGGTAVALDALESAAAGLRRAAGSLVEVVARVAAGSLAVELGPGSAVSPVTAVRAKAAVLEATGPTGLAGDVLVLEGLGSAAWAAVETYRAGEAAVADGVAAAQDAVMLAVGHALPEVVVGVLALDALGVDVAGFLDRGVYDLPALVGLTGGVEGLVAGLASNPVTAPFLLPGELSRRPGEPGLAGLPLGSDERALRVLADSAASLGLLEDGQRARVTAEGSGAAGSAPTDLADLTRDLADLGGGADQPDRVRVVEVVGERGSAWLLEVPGTRVWGPRASGSPFDLTTDVRLMAQESTVLAAGATEALSRAQASCGHDTSGEPVMLVGHSLGGIVAAGLASSPRFRSGHGRLSVVTLGAPVSRMPVPADVSVLSLEHVQDAVPRLDGAGNPDREGWVTVTRDLRGDADGVETATRAHATSEYVQTAAGADASDSTSMRVWRQGHAGFFAPAAGAASVVRDYRVERVVP
jgi:hypothetical protein